MRLTGPTIPASNPVEITFNGRKLQAYEGESIAAALSAHDIVALRRTASGSERGLWCGMGACYDCVVTVDGRIGERACMTRVRAGMVIESSPPATLAEAAPLAPLPNRGALEERHCDVLVIGAGPGGLAAAVAAGRMELHVTVLDERAQVGGQFYKPLAPSQRFTDRGKADAQMRAGSALEREARTIGVKIESGATVWGAFSPTDIGVLIGDRAVVYRPKRVVLAPGAIERPVPIPGWTLPGVMTTGALQTLARAYRVAPGKRVLIAGNGPLNLQLALELLAGGVQVVGVVETARPPWQRNLLDAIRLAAHGADLMGDGVRYLARLRSAGVPVYWRHAVVQARGDAQFREAQIMMIDAKGSPIPGSEKTLIADVLTLGYGFIPSVEIARALGCRLKYSERHVGYLTVETGDEGRTTVPGIYAIGDGADLGGARVAHWRGQIAGLTVAEVLGRSMARAGIGKALDELEHALQFQHALWRMFDAPPFNPESITSETTVCRCEGVSAGAIRQVFDEGFTSIGAVKRHTRCGMGRCQGRYCAPIAARMVQSATGIAPGPSTLFAPRPPIRPVPIAALALERPEWGGHKSASDADAGDADAPVSAPAQSTTPLPRMVRIVREPLSPSEAHADVVVIGGGAVGTCCAYFLAEAGVDVVVLERDELNLQASGANAGSLHVQLLSFDFGPKAQAGGFPASETLPLGPESVRLWQELQSRCGESFEIQTGGGLMVAETEAQMRFLEAKIARERSFGIEAELLDANALHRLAPGLSERMIGAEFCAAEGKINPMRATYSVARRAQALGARFSIGAEVQAIESTAEGYLIRTARGVVLARRIVNAAGPWAARIAAMVGLRNLPVQGAPLQMLVTEPAPKLLNHLVAHADRHLSLKQADTGGFIIGGGWTAGTDPTIGFARPLRSSIEGNLWVAQRVVPALDRLRLVRAWAAMNVNIDGAPILGEAPGQPGFFNCVTSNGYTLAPIVGKITADLLRTGRSDIPIDPYTLERFE